MFNFLKYFKNLLFLNTVAPENGATVKSEALTETLTENSEEHSKETSEKSLEKNIQLNNLKKVIKIQGDNEYSKTRQEDPDYNTITWGFANYGEGRNIVIGDLNYIKSESFLILGNKNISNKTFIDNEAGNVILGSNNNNNVLNASYINGLDNSNNKMKQANIHGNENKDNNLERSSIYGNTNDNNELYNSILLGDKNTNCKGYSSLLIYSDKIKEARNSILFNNNNIEGAYQCLAFGNTNLKLGPAFSILFGNYDINNTLNSCIVFNSSKGYYNASIGFFNDNVIANHSIAFFSKNANVYRSFSIGTSNNFSTKPYDLYISNTFSINFFTDIKTLVTNSFINNFKNKNNNKIVNSIIQTGSIYNTTPGVAIKNSFIQTNYNLENSANIINSYLKIISNDDIKINYKVYNSFIHCDNVSINEDIENSFALGKDLQVKNQTLIFGNKNDSKKNTLVEIANEGNVFEINKETGAASCPKLEVTDIQDLKTLVTKEYVDNKFTSNSYNVYKVPLVKTNEIMNSFKVNIEAYQKYSTFYIEIDQETEYNKIEINVDTNPNYKVLAMKFTDKEKAKDFIQNYKKYLIINSESVIAKNYDFYLERTLNDYLNYINNEYELDFDDIIIKFSLQRDILRADSEELNNAVYIGLLWIGTSIDQPR